MMYVKPVTINCTYKVTYVDDKRKTHWVFLPSYKYVDDYTERYDILSVEKNYSKVPVAIM